MKIVTDLSKEFHPVPKSGRNKTKPDSKKGQIKQKSKKLAKLERQRDKELIKTGRCECCGKVCKKLDPHEVYGGSNRKRSIKNKFIKLLCRECHSNEKVIAQLRIDTQKEYEKNHTREEFIKLIRKKLFKQLGQDNNCPNILQKEETMARDSFIFYRSFYEAISELSKEDQADTYNAIMQYALNQKEIQLKGISKAIFSLVKPQLDANYKKYENGKQKKSKIEAKRKQK